MSVRPSMADLILRCRTLIHDPSPGTAFPDDQVIQDALDRRRIERRWVALRPVQTFVPGGGIFYYDFYSDASDWESDIILQDVAFDNITASADVMELNVGHFHFPTQPNGIAVRATGKTYDLYGSAADLLDSWAAQVTLDYDFSSTRQSFARSQKFDMLRKLAEEYRQRALPVSGRLVQSDAAPDHDGSGVVYASLYGPSAGGL